MSIAGALTARLRTCALCLVILAAAHERARAQLVQVDLELVLAVDVSASVDDRDYGLQVEGLRRAFLDPALVAAINTAGGKGIAVTLVQWSSWHQQSQVVPWTHVHDEASANNFAHLIETNAVRRYDFGTAIGSALEFAAGLIDTNHYLGRRRSIDLSGDGQSNNGPAPEGVRDRLVARGYTINGLAIIEQDSQLTQYFEERVIGGPDAFVIEVGSFEHIIRGTRTKLLREIGAPVAINASP